MAKRRTKKKLSPLKIGAIIIVGGGIGYLLYSQVIKRFIFKDDTSGGDDVPTFDNTQTQLPPVTTSPGAIGGGSNAAVTSAGTTPKVDIDKKIKKGDKGELVYKIQLAINNVAKLRGKSYWWDNDKKKNVQFPLPTDPVRAEFADRTDSGAKFAFPSYRASGYITVRKAREQWARSAGYFNKPFPTELTSASNYADLKKIYDINRAKKQANDESDFNWNVGAGILAPGAALGYAVGSILNP